MNEKSKKAKKGTLNGAFLATAGYILVLGSSLAFSALLGLYIGSLLDRGRPQKIFAPIGFLFGLAIGFHRAYVVIGNLIKKEK